MIGNERIYAFQYICEKAGIEKKDFKRITIQEMMDQLNSERLTSLAAADLMKLEKVLQRFYSLYSTEIDKFAKNYEPQEIHDKWIPYRLDKPLIVSSITALLCIMERGKD
jgi:hypothetical protein